MDEWIEWPILAKVGNIPIVKATIVAPFLAQVVVNSEHNGPFHSFLLNIVNYHYLHWLYWSLICLGLAQIIFQTRCPEMMRKYGLKEDYLNIRSSNATKQELDNEWWKGYRAHYQKYGGELSLPEYMELYDIKKLVEEFEFKNRTVLESDREKIATSLFALQHNAINKEITIIPDSDVLGFMFHFPELLTGDSNDNSLEQRSARSSLSWYIHSRCNSEEWRKHAIESTYHQQRLSRPMSRRLSSLFYVLGFVYFLVTVPMNIYEMVKRTYTIF